jgi:Flavin containing amine oxidoreductase
VADVIDRSKVERELDAGMADDLDLDVAIVGGGVGGLYTGYRLISGEPVAGSRDAWPPTVNVFELGSRIGGRLHSVVLPGLQIAGELGGMRYLTSMQIVTGLIERVFAGELTHVDFSMGNPASLFFYLRKQRFRANAWTEAQRKAETFRTHYALNPDDVGFSPDQLFNKVIYDVLIADPEIKAKFGQKLSNPKRYEYDFKLDARDWDAIKPVVRYQFEGPFEGRLVNDLGMWNLFKDRTSEEGLQFLADAGGYYSNTINWNAGEGFQLMVGDFSGPMVSYRTIEGGYDQVAYALAQALLAHRGVKIWKENGAVGLRRGAQGARRRYELTLANQASGRQWTVHTDAVVLAMPRRSLELVDRSGSYFELFDGPDGPKFRAVLPTTIIEPSMKIMMAFEVPWWREEFGALSGESITDLPMRQCYYFGTDPHDHHSLFLSSYNDMDTVSFWKALEQQELFAPRATRLAAQSDLDALGHLQAPRVMVEEALAEVRELHGPKIAVPEPYATLFKDWSHDPFGGGYHAWSANISVADTMRYMRQPRPGEAIHVCGEAYSDQQGWVEGALCTAERMLQEHFGLAWPSWLDADYYLGW